MIEVPEPPHAHHKSGFPWFDLIMALAVLAISVASLLTSAQSEKSMKALVEQNRRMVEAQSMPLLMLDSGNEDDKGNLVLNLTISNVGTGAAQIAWFRATDSQGMDDSGDAVQGRVEKVEKRATPQYDAATNVIDSTMLRSGAERKVWSWPKPTDNPAALAEWERLNKARFNLHASACYCSIFDECKITEFGSSHPRPVASCTQDPPKQ